MILKLILINQQNCVCTIPNYINIYKDKTIIDYQTEIKEYQRRERGFLVQLHLKEKEVRYLDNQIKDMQKKSIEQQTKSSEGYFDPLLLNEIKILKSLLKEKNEKLLLKEEELCSLQSTQNKYNHLF